MKSFEEYIRESLDSTVVVAFGRFQPPTIGHAKLIKKMRDESRGSAYKIFASHTVDPIKDPLHFDEKMDVLKKMFPEDASHFMTNSSAKNPFDAILEVEKQGFKNLIFVCGSDHVSAWQRDMTKYNGKDYNFYSVNVVSAGDRDPDGDAASAISASKMRAFAKSNDFDSFKKGLPKSYPDAMYLFQLLQTRLGLSQH